MKKTANDEFTDEAWPKRQHPAVMGSWFVYFILYIGLLVCILLFLVGL